MEKKADYFGKTLEKFLLTSNVKNYTVAKALNYDVSYISKWISASALPSKKNADFVMETIAETISGQVQAEYLENLCRSLGVTDRNLLKKALQERLSEAYCAASGQAQQSRYFNNAAFSVRPDGKHTLTSELVGSGDPFNREKPLRIAVMADLFAMERKVKLSLAGIENSRFRIREKCDGIRMDFIIDLDGLSGKEVYDVILLIHLLTHYSLTDFQLSYSRGAAGKLVFAVENRWAEASVLGGRRQFLCTSSVTELKTVNGLYEAILTEQDPDRMIFQTADMDDMLRSREYIRALLSREEKWLIGHVTEHLLSKELFERLSEEIFGQQPELLCEGKRAHALTCSAAGQNGIELMIYDTALTDFVMTGEVDFFNHKVVIPPEERKKQLQHMRSLLAETQGLQVKMVRGGFSDDFKYITNPCMFLSGDIDCLRLENGCYSNNLLPVKDKSLQKVFHTFFEEIWNNRPDVVLADRNSLLEKLDGLLSAADLLAGVDSKEK